MPDFNDKLKQLATTRRESCEQHAPFDTHENRRIGLATLSTGKVQEAFERSILSQMMHVAVHNTSAHIACEQLADGPWGKIAFLLNLVMSELLKPKETRLEWIFWIDRDAIILDPCRPLSSFIPPNTPDFEHINLVINRDFIGFNAGLFFFKVNDWSVRLLTTVLAFRYYRPNEQLNLAEQTAMEIVLYEAPWQGQYVQVPQYWFNSYPHGIEGPGYYETKDTPKNVESHRALKGDFVIHFAGHTEKSKEMLSWLDMNDKMEVWKQGDVKRNITREIEQYWESYRARNLTIYQLTGDPKDLVVQTPETPETPKNSTG